LGATQKGIQIRGLPHEGGRKTPKKKHGAVSNFTKTTNSISGAQETKDRAQINSLNKQKEKAKNGEVARPWRHNNQRKKMCGIQRLLQVSSGNGGGTIFNWFRRRNGTGEEDV